LQSGILPTRNYAAECGLALSEKKNHGGRKKGTSQGPFTFSPFPALSVQGETRAGTGDGDKRLLSGALDQLLESVGCESPVVVLAMLNG
jgi:hypothetical protein